MSGIRSNGQLRRSGLRLVTWLVLFRTMLIASLAAQDTTYYPGPWGSWETRDPAELGFDPARLAAAVEFAQRAENQSPRELHNVIAVSFANEPHNAIVGPVQDRGGASGMIVKNGYIVAEWGDTTRVDMTFSVTKSYLSTVAGLAVDDHIIRDLSDSVGGYVRDGKFAGEHNAAITWQHLLQQTSDWSGELWGKPDWADRPVGSDREAWVNRELHAPGTHFKYNDVRVNLLAYSLLQVYRRPLPVILRERIMDPIGASPTWRWHGYENSWVTLDGQQVQSVSGGGHWGGGLFICARDHARFGYLFLRNGRWGDQQLISEDWIRELRVPAEANSDYGCMWWLNTDRKRIPAAPESIFYAAGFGGNYIYVDQENDLLVVLRWTPDLAGVIEKIMASREQ
jgi:CubicO group peptidase (beta-lactamase class C family)